MTVKLFESTESIEDLNRQITNWSDMCDPIIFNTSLSVCVTSYAISITCEIEEDKQKALDMMDGIESLDGNGL